MGDFHEACKTLSPEAFVAKLGPAFFLHHGPLDKLSRPLDDSSTARVDQPDSLAGGAIEPKEDFLVLPLYRPTPGLAPPDMVWIGRSDANEVIIPDASVSEVHAFVQVEGDRFFLQDTGSRNGTRINNVKVLPQGRGDPVSLTSGSRVRFGTVKMTFLLAEQFRTLVLGLLG